MTDDEFDALAAGGEIATTDDRAIFSNLRPSSFNDASPVMMVQDSSAILTHTSGPVSQDATFLQDTWSDVGLESMNSELLDAPIVSQWQSPSTFAVGQNVYDPPRAPMPFPALYPYSMDHTLASPVLGLGTASVPQGLDSHVSANAALRVPMPSLAEEGAPSMLTTGAHIASAYRRHDTSGYVFRCNIMGCRNVTFRRWHDFERHDNTFHNGTSVLWCPETGCNRSKDPRNEPFPKVRKDKLREHVRKKHGYEYDD